MKSLTLIIALAFAFFLPLPASAQALAVAASASDSAGPASEIAPEQQRWLDASLSERNPLAEEIGEQGARQWAKSQGWREAVPEAQGGFRRGPDQVYLDRNGVVHAIEAKGGNSQLGMGYGYKQATPEWAVESARRTLKSPLSSAAKKAEAKLVLKAAAEGKLEVHTVRTEHVLGKARQPVLKQTLKGSDEAARLASAALDEFFLSSPSPKPADLPEASSKATPAAVNPQATESSATPKANRWARVLGRPLVVVGLAVDTAQRVDRGAAVEDAYQSGGLSLQERERQHGENVAGMAGGWGASWVGFTALGPAGAAIGTAVMPGVGTAVGYVVVGGAGGVVAYFAGEAAAEYVAGEAVALMHEAGLALTDMLEQAREGIVFAWENPVEAAILVQEWVVVTTDPVVAYLEKKLLENGEAIADAADAVVESAADTYVVVEEFVVDRATAAGEAAVDAYEATEEFVVKNAKAAGEAAVDGYEATTEAAGDAIDWAGETAGDLWRWATE